MLQQLRFSSPSQYFNIFYVSCMHLGHDREFVYKPRGFNSITEHDNAMVERWNERIKNTDVVHSIGDTIFGQNADVRLEEYFRKLNFWKLYISPGNHFSGWHQIYNRVLTEKYGAVAVNKLEVYPLEYQIAPNKTVYFMPNLYEIYVGRQPAVLCHYPIFPHHGAAKGVWGIFGHCHGNNAVTNKNTGTGKVIDVCIESFGGPVSHLEIEEILKNRKAEDVSHHTPSTKCAI